MPSTSDEMRQWMREFHGTDEIDDQTAIVYLEQQGYDLLRNWHWSKPGVTLETMTEDEYRNMLYLIEEWDFGGLV